MTSRMEMRARLTDGQRFDLIVIGGGITGCGVAYEAAARGARVAVLEQGDFAVGTSSRSTKLIHGGIRYLKQFDLRLVREGVQERQNLIEAAPYLVQPIRFVYPIHEGDPDSLLALRMGLLVYDWFAGKRNLLRHQVFPGKSILQEEPLLKEEGLKGAALYADCLTDDARLTVEVAKAAARKGAVLVNYMPVRQFLYDDNGLITGVVAADRLGDGTELRLHASAVLNATGPWVDTVRQLDEPGCWRALRPTKGVHIAVRHERLPIRHPVVMHAADQRLMFAVPRDGFTYLGTTDTDYNGNPEALGVDPADVAYILDATNRTFPTVKLGEDDVMSVWAGLRSLAAASEELGPSQVSRDYRLLTSRSGLVSVLGGKLTAFQAMARSIVKRMLPMLSPQALPLELAGTPEIPSPAELAEMGRQHAFLPEDMQSMLARHGGEVRRVLAYVGAGLAGGRARLLAAEAAFAVEHEFAVTLSDVLNRRTSQLLFSQDNGTQIMHAVADAMAARLGWDETERQAQIDAYRTETQAMMAWRSAAKVSQRT